MQQDMNSARHRKGNEVVPCRMPPSKEDRSFMLFLWNPNAKTVMGRTAASWGKIGLFYIIFYSFLAAFFSLLMVIFYQTLDYNIPKLTGDDSLLRNPGLSFRPTAYNPDDLRPTLSYYPSRFGPYIDSLESFWKPYKSRPSNAVDCLSSGKGSRDQVRDQVCFFNVDALNTNCTPANGWGYDSYSPCIILKLNKIFHWEPLPYEDLDGLPEGLRNYLNKSENTQEMLQENIWVWCESEDVEIEQTSPALPVEYFPYLNQEGYLAPFVTVRLLNLRVNEKVKVECRVWARNVIHKLGRRRLAEARIYVEALG